MYVGSYLSRTLNAAKTTYTNTVLLVKSIQRGACRVDRIVLKSKVLDMDCQEIAQSNVSTRQCNVYTVDETRQGEDRSMRHIRHRIEATLRYGVVAIESARVQCRTPNDYNR